MTPDSIDSASADPAAAEAVARIPILNLYYLLCYAWNHVQEQDTRRLRELEAQTRTRDLLGKVLAGGVNHLFRRGIDRGYMERREDLAGIRGKLAISEMAKRALRARGRTACDFEELSIDTLPNRILRSSLHRLMHSSIELDNSLRPEIRTACRRLDGVSRIRLRRSTFTHIRLGSNRRLYRFLLSVCKLLHNNCIVDQETGQETFRDFRRDAATMWKLFEHFVTGFYRREASAYSVGAQKQIKWTGVEGTTEADRSLIPRMKADLILTSDARRIVMDTKFYRESLSGGKLRSDHLYQLLAYLRNRQAGCPEGPRHEGILLYPQVREPLHARICLEGFRIQARTIDLNRDWSEIHDEMLNVLAA